MLDLNGFKTYNDTFGHGAGDLLLTRLGTALAAAVGDRGKTYRMGGDEFTVLAPCAFGDADAFADLCGAALVADGTGFCITASYGAAELPAECSDGVSALKLADERMYRHKNSGRVAAAAQSAGVLMAVLEERAPDLATRGRAVRDISMLIAAELSLDDAERESLSHAAALHEIGTLAMPREIDDDDKLLRHQPEVAERILSAAIALAPSARIVRSTRERVDGGGFPDALHGDDIPLGARIIAVASAFESAREATGSNADGQAEVSGNAGTAFDARIVAALELATSPVAVA
jgi:diguanylate cyclase (GGDEF)-like protein